MDFSFSEEQSMLKDSVTRFVQDNYDFESRRTLAASDAGFSTEHWQTFAELGWLSIPFSEGFGGFGGGVVDSMVVMEELGKGLVLEPYLATVLLFGGLLQKSGNQVVQDAYIGSIIEGSLQGAFAFVERDSRFVLNAVRTRAEKSDGSYWINGEKTVVINGASADKIVVSARTSGNTHDEGGISLFVIDSKEAGVKISSYRMMDGQVVANISLDQVSVSTDHMLGEEGEALEVMQEVINDAMIAVSAEALGAMEKALQITVDYTKIREQFGVAIGSFQVLQHRMVDMFTAVQETRSLLYRAACSLEAGSDEAIKDLYALKVKVGRAGKLVGEEAMQLHGGMGMTDELDVGHYAKRLRMINTLFGDADFCQQRFAQLSYR